MYLFFRLMYLFVGLVQLFVCLVCVILAQTMCDTRYAELITSVIIKISGKSKVINK